MKILTFAVQMNYQALQNMIMTAVKMGYQQGYTAAARSFSKSFNDELKAKDAKAWCQYNQVSYPVFASLVEDGKIKPYRKSSAENAAIYYNISDINKALCNADIQLYAMQMCAE